MKTGIYIGLGVLVLVLGWFGWQWYQNRKPKGKADATLTRGKSMQIDQNAFKNVLSQLNQTK